MWSTLDPERCKRMMSRATSSLTIAFRHVSWCRQKGRYNIFDSIDATRLGAATLESKIEEMTSCARGWTVKVQGTSQLGVVLLSLLMRHLNAQVWTFTKVNNEKVSEAKH